MSIKADFYVGIGPDAEWLGSIFKGGSVWEIPTSIFIQVNQTMFEEMVLELLSSKESVVHDRGDKWDHDWSDSRLTDYTYMFDPAREKVLMYQSGTDCLVDPIKILQGYGISECIELYGTPKFPTMKKDPIMKTEELLKEYGYTITEPL